ncbi:MAG: hypothetical protein ABGA11_02680 [Liquorilactobacillus hordei]|uniref:hypothetical protein n=1 Tax=Liquorilactobacillus hordei TaxID=468911 RepID=UPI0039EC9B5B
METRQDKELLEQLEQLNTLLGSWDEKSLEQAEHILKDARAMITVLNDHSLAELTSSEKVIIDQIVQKYNKLISAFSAQKKQLSQKISQLSRPNSTIRTYLQQEQGASLIDVDF